MIFMRRLLLCYIYFFLAVHDVVEPLESSGEGTNMTHEEIDSDTIACTQLVVYDPPKILPQFQEPEKRFEFAGREWVILQRWNDLGVPAVVWEAAIVLSEYLESTNGAAVAGKRVLELGSGTGLVGMVASALGAQSVVLTDRNIASTLANIQANQENLKDRQITVSLLEWGQDVSSFNPPFDVLLAADVLYIEESFPLLLQSLCDLSAHETTIFLSCKHRYEREDRFIKMAQSVFRTTEVLVSDHTLKIYRLDQKSHKQ